MDGIPALDLWDLVVEVSHFLQLNQRKPKIKHEARCVTPHQTSTPKTILKIQSTTILLSNVDFVSSIVKSSLFGARLCIFEDNGSRD